MKSLMSVVALLASAFVATAGPVVVATSNATTLVNAIVGPGITVVGTPTYTGSANQSGTFTNGGNLGFASGIVLTTGNATAISGSNGSGVETLGGNVNNGQFSAADNLSVDLGLSDFAHEARVFELAKQLRSAMLDMEASAIALAQEAA